MYFTRSPATSKCLLLPRVLATFSQADGDWWRREEGLLIAGYTSV